MTRTRILAAGMIVALGLSLGACSTDDSASGKAAKSEEAISGDTANRSLAVVGKPDVKAFAEKANLKRRYEALDSPTATGYVYLINYGLIFAEMRVKGKVSSMNSQFTNPERYRGCGTDCGVTLPQQEPDGSYGANPEGIFFWTTDGIYKEWTGDYLYSKERLDLRQPPQVSIQKQVK